MLSLVNFRDLGGFVTNEGLKVKPRCLLRSGEVVNLEVEDAESLVNEYQLKQIIDFRSTNEIDERPNDFIVGVSSLHINILKDTEENMASQEGMMKHLNPELADTFMKEINRQFIISESAKLGYQQFLRACLNQEEGAILFHCAAGKDRTGFGAALILKLLGVSDEDIMMDYLKTVEQRAEANKVMIEEYRQKGLSEEQLNALATFMNVKEDYLEAAFETIEQEYGDFENYIKNGLGITEHEIKLLKQKYLM